MAKTFYSKTTVYDPDYRNVQSELWQLLTEDQQKVVASVFCHLKNHAQIEIAEALIDYIEADIHPQASDWSDTTIGSMFYVLVFRLFDKDLTANLPSTGSGQVRACKTETIGEAIKRVFPSFLK